MKRLLITFVGLCAVIFVVSLFFGSNSISIWVRLGYSAIMSVIASVLWVSGISSKRVKASDSDKSKTVHTDCDIHSPLDPKVLYRVRGNKIHKGFDAAPTYETKANKVYSNLGPKPVYRIEGNKVYCKMEPAPILEIKGAKIYKSLNSKVAYEIKKPQA